MPSLAPASPCPCGSGRPFRRCCGPLLTGTPAATAEALMRSRYTAWVLGDLDHLRRTWHPATCPADLAIEPGVQWRRLRVLRVCGGGEGESEGTVTFEATCKQAGRAHRLRETSQFTRVAGRWLYVGAVTQAEE